MADVEQPVKKKPGRPKKQVVVEPIEINGIVKTPAVEAHRVELVYYNPVLFKKILALLTSYHVSEVEMSFDAEGLKINAMDHLKKSNIIINFEGKYSNHYYCREPVRIYVTRAELAKAIGILGKNHYRIYFILKEEDYRTRIYISINDMDYSTDELYTIGVVGPGVDAAVKATYDDSKYPLRFKVSSAHFKTRIENIGALSPALRIEKIGEGNLKFTHDPTKTTTLTGTYNDSGKINLQSTIADGEIFVVTVPVDYIRPFSKSTIGDEVIVAVDRKEKISFTTYLDKKDNNYACTVKIFTEIHSNAKPAV